jgi:hypothetical protein
MLKQLEAREDLDDDDDEAIDVEADQRLEAQLLGLQRKYSAGRAGGRAQGAGRPQLPWPLHCDRPLAPRRPPATTVLTPRRRRCRPCRRRRSSR